MSLPNNYVCEGQMSIFEILNHDTWYGKTYQEPSVQTTEKTLDVCLKKCAELRIKPPMFLDLRRGGGQSQDASWVLIGPLLGDYMMLSFGESPNVVRESRLSQILEDNPHPKYCLSEKAYQGILRRAATRGKKLPEVLEQALIRQATPSKLGGGVEVDSHGRKAGKGALIQTELSATLGVSQDQTLITNKCLNSVLQNPIYSIGHDIRSSKLTADEKTDPLTASDYKEPIKVIDSSVVRRLTPLECERLQGYPDHWTDIGEWIDSKGKKHKDADSPRYKALGNSIALPFWEWMAERMVKELDKENPAMASLFDGIGGFPLVYSRCGCKPVWASEIEEFPMAVTKIRFPEVEDGKCE